MFELLLIIYLLPVLIIGMLLLKLVLWLLRIVIRLAGTVLCAQMYGAGCEILRFLILQLHENYGQ